MNELLADLAKAKDAVRWLLDHSDGRVDMKGIVYWAGRVDTLRHEIRKGL